MEQVPVLLFGEKFWREIVNWDALAEAGTIARDDLDLFRFVETAEDAVAVDVRFPRESEMATMGTLSVVSVAPSFAPNSPPLTKLPTWWR
jgi:predicted Rossmann-fold nucleotide-binding protein